MWAGNSWKNKRRQTGPVNGYFSGGKSFVSNGYVIWKDGLDGDLPNPYGVMQGKEQVSKMFYKRSMDIRSSYRKLIDYLTAIQEKEAAKERQHLLKKVKAMANSFQDKGYQQKLFDAINSNNFGLAYSLIYKKEKDLAALQKELQSSHFNNISHMNSFWNDQFSTYFTNRMMNELEIRNHQLVKKITSNTTISISSLIDDYFDSILNGNKGLVRESFNQLSKQMKEELLKVFQKAGFTSITNEYDDIFGKDNNFMKLANRKTTKLRNGQDKKLSAAIRDVGDALGSVGKGIAQELSVASQGAKTGSIAINTGFVNKIVNNKLTGKGYSVQQKADDVFIDIFDQTYDIGKLGQELFQAISRYPNKGMTELNKKLEEYAQQNQVEDIFLIEVNVKGYRSKRNLKIEGEGSFANRANNLVHIAEEAEGIPPLSMEKLIFMLNNTVEGCIAANEKEYLTDYLSAICVAWMWDDYTELFSIGESSKTSIKKIRLFSSGGMYYSASQIIQQTINKLQGLENSINFVNINIEPPNFNANTKYGELKNKYPVPSRLSSKQEWQGVLSKRWDEMKNYVMNKGTLSIDFSQSELEKLIGNLNFLMK